MKQFKRVTAVVLMIAVVLTMFAACAFAMDMKVTTTGKTNLRKGASLNTKSLKTISKGKTIHITDFKFDDRNVVWYKTTYGGKSGWVSGKYIKAGSQKSYDEVVAEYGKTFLRKSPDRTSKELKTIHKGDSVEFLHKTSKDSRGMIWFKVDADGTTGWVSAKYCELQ